MDVNNQTLFSYSSILDSKMVNLQFYTHIGEMSFKMKSWKTDLYEHT